MSFLFVFKMGQQGMKVLGGLFYLTQHSPPPPSPQRERWASQSHQMGPGINRFAKNRNKLIVKIVIIKKKREKIYCVFCLSWISYKFFFYFVLKFIQGPFRAHNANMVFQQSVSRRRHLFAGLSMRTRVFPPLNWETWSDGSYEILAHCLSGFISFEPKYLELYNLQVV